MYYPSDTLLSPDSVERLARKRTGMRLGWLIHAFVFVAVNLTLAGFYYVSGRYWTHYPLLGWGLGLCIHGAVVWLSMPGTGFYQHLLERERDHLRDPRPWA